MILGIILVVVGLIIVAGTWFTGFGLLGIIPVIIGIIKIKNRK